MAQSPKDKRQVTLQSVRIEQAENMCFKEKTIQKRVSDGSDMGRPLYIIYNNRIIIG